MENRIKTVVVEDQRLGIDLIRGCLDDRFDLVETCKRLPRGGRPSAGTIRRR